MSARVKWEGLAELRADLRRLPAELAGEAGQIVDTAGNGAAATVRTEYGQHRVTGSLADHVKVEHVASGPYGASVVVKSTAKHAWLFDNGSQARHFVEASGKEHGTGQMWGKRPPMHTFVRAMIRARRRMFEELKAMLERHGLKVSGDA